MESNNTSGVGGGHANSTLVSSITTKLNALPQLTPEWCIFKVPESLRKVNEEAYSPQLVSIGPFHRGTKRLQSMEVHKLRYLKDFLSREPKKDVHYYIENLRRSEERVRRCYSESFKLTSDEFVEMMLMDGSFIIETMLKNYVDKPRDSKDPILSTSWMGAKLLMDMLLIENQLPLFFIEHLFNLISSPHNKYLGNSLFGLTLQFLRISFCTKDLARNVSQSKNFVDIYRKAFVPSSPRVPPKRKVEVEIPSATMLEEAGVKFEKGGDENCFVDVNFNNGVLIIPSFNITDDTEIAYRNVIALEHFGKDPNYLTSYMTLMDSLIDTANDVALLRKSGIVNNWLGDDEEVSNMFNNIGKGTIFDPETFDYAAIFEDINIYYKTTWNKWIAKLKRDYFDTPWSITAFVVGGVVSICTIIQTVHVFCQNKKKRQTVTAQSVTTQ